MRKVRVPPGPAYFGAAHRKIEIAKYHLEHLLARLESSPKLTAEGYSPVDVQAHFEGVLFSIKAAVDQITELIGSVLKCRYRNALAEGSKAIPSLKTWREDPFFDELNELRRLAAHHAYVKRPGAPQECWTVQEVGSSYTGSRELGAYCRAVVRYGETLVNLTEAVAEQLVSGNQA